MAGRQLTTRTRYATPNAPLHVSRSRTVLTLSSSGAESGCNSDARAVNVRRRQLVSAGVTRRALHDGVGGARCSRTNGPVQWAETVLTSGQGRARAWAGQRHVAALFVETGFQAVRLCTVKRSEVF